MVRETRRGFQAIRCIFGCCSAHSGIGLCRAHGRLRHFDDNSRYRRCECPVVDRDGVRHAAGDERHFAGWCTWLRALTQLKPNDRS